MRQTRKTTTNRSSVGEVTNVLLKQPSGTWALVLGKKSSGKTGDTWSTGQINEALNAINKRRHGVTDLHKQKPLYASKRHLVKKASRHHISIGDFGNAERTVLTFGGPVFPVP